MEFDIVDWRRWSSTLLTVGAIVRFAVVDGVRLGWTLYSWSMEFDIVELWNTATMCLRDERRWSSTRLDFVQLVDGVRHC